MKLEGFFVYEVIMFFFFCCCVFCLQICKDEVILVKWISPGRSFTKALLQWLELREAPLHVLCGGAPAEVAVTPLSCRPAFHLLPSVEA